jgi:hypothetical protein
MVCCVGRAGSSTSTEDLSSPIQSDSTASNKDDVSIASAQSISNASNDNEEEDRLINLGFKYVASSCTALLPYIAYIACHAPAFAGRLLVLCVLVTEPLFVTET